MATPQASVTQEQPSQPEQQVQQTDTQGSQQNQPIVESEQQPAVSIKEFNISADDYGFYINGESIALISISSGDEVKVTFNVNNDRVYYAGLDFRGCNLNTGEVKPGGSILVEFAAESDCTITSYWPSSGRVKARLNVAVV